MSKKHLHNHKEEEFEEEINLDDELEFNVINKEKKILSEPKIYLPNMTNKRIN